MAATPRPGNSQPDSNANPETSRLVSNRRGGTNQILAKHAAVDGHPGVDVRVHYLDASGAMQPSRKGLWLHAHEITALIQVLIELQAESGDGE